MSLYHEAAEILAKVKTGDGSLKTAVFGKKTWKSDAKTLYALTAEAAKWSPVLSEVVEHSGILKIERNLTPELTLLLVHDLLLARQGVRLPAKHGLHIAIARNKARLSAELTKARLRRGHATLDALRTHVNAGATTTNGSSTDAPKPRQPRWIRINTLRSTLDEELSTTFAEHDRVSTIAEVMRTPADKSSIYIDEHIANLVAIVGTSDPSKFKAYRAGKLVFQEKASCFPAYLLNPGPDDRHVIDACAAPGNKTTHLAAQMGGVSDDMRVTACEKDPERSKTLEKMVKLAGADGIVTVKQKQDFLKLEPQAKEFADVTALLLDPSCSGSGILNRDEGTFTVHLPSATAQRDLPNGSGNHKKRKRGQSSKTQSDNKPAVIAETADTVIEEETPETKAESEDKATLATRLQTLSTFQLRLLQHAMLFPAARKITYSTCSVHDEENENVVVRALLSAVASGHGWRIMRRDEQPIGMQKWHKRGSLDAVKEISKVEEHGEYSELDHEEIAQACIRCDKRGEDGTMGFFVAGFVRDDEAIRGNMQKAVTNNKEQVASGPAHGDTEGDEQREDEEEDEWNGFGDDDD